MSREQLALKSARYVIDAVVDMVETIIVVFISPVTAKSLIWLFLRPANLLLNCETVNPSYFLLYEAFLTPQFALYR